MKLTDNQYALLIGNTTPNKSTNEHMRWLENESIVEFTDASFTYSNAEFTINSDPNHLIWFSQLSNIGLTKDLELVGGLFVLKNGTRKHLFEMNVDEFWRNAQGKRFAVIVPDNQVFSFNAKSEKWNDIPGRKYSEARDYVERCIKDGKYSELYDFIKPNSIYHLVEV